MVFASVQVPGCRGLVDIAHRGSSGQAPENTLAAVHLAVAQQTRFVEVDVQRSADCELVIMHDATLERTTDAADVFPGRAPWRVGDFTFAELRRLDAGSSFAGYFAGEPIPTLREVIDVLGPDTGLLLEIKDPHRHPGIELAVYQELCAIPDYLGAAVRAGGLVVQSFDHESMGVFHGCAPEIPVGLLFDERPTDGQLVSAGRWARQVNTDYRVTDAALIERIHRLGMTTSVYTVNAERDMRRLADTGVDGIITNYPTLLNAVGWASELTSESLLLQSVEDIVGHDLPAAVDA